MCFSKLGAASARFVAAKQHASCSERSCRLITNRSGEGGSQQPERLKLIRAGLATAHLQSSGVANQRCLSRRPAALDHAQQQREAAGPGRVCVWPRLYIHGADMSLRIILQHVCQSSEPMTC